MGKRKNYKKRRTEEKRFHLKIPEGPAPRPEGGFLEIRSGAGHQSYQQYAEYCLNEQGGTLGLGSFEAYFTAWSLEGAGGIVLYPEGPAFRVVGLQFSEGDEPVTFQADAAYYTALMLCLHPTIYAPDASGDEPLTSYEVLQSLEPGDAEPGGGYTDIPFVPQKPILSTGEIFMTKFNYYPHKVSYKIRIFPSPAGRNTMLLGGRLGTVPSESI